ncbi:hypothetical protein GCM10009848_33940 [Micromonospora lupini]
MIERGNGRTAGQTAWHLMDVNSMWACLQDHDTTNHWKQVAGWRKVCDLAQIHLGRLQEYRRGLAEAWPPETSAASGTYLAQLDDLIAKVRHTHDAAAANYTALSAATQAIGTTRAELRKIHEEYAAKLHQKQAYDATAADPKAIMGNRVVDPPVTDGELERLNVQARSMMFNLSGELQQAQATLQKPPPSPRVNPGIDQSDADVYGGSVAAPVIPPIVPVPSATPSIIRPGSTAASQTGAASASSIGPVLGGVGGTVPAGPPNPAPPTGLTPLSPPFNSTPSIGATPMPPTIPTRGPTPGAHSLPHTNNRLDTGAGFKGNPSVQPPPMPPGGLIGGVPGAGLGQPGNSAPSPRRINPVGGVIGGGGAGTGPTGGAGSRPGGGRGVGAMNGVTPFSISTDSGGTGVTPSSYPTRRPATPGMTNEQTNGWDPDHPWQTEKGVAPVVRPPDEGPIDPGPAIGLGR